MRMFLSTSYFASLAKSPIRFPKGRCITGRLAGRVVVAMSVTPVVMMGLGESEEGFFQPGVGDLEVRKPRIPMQQLANHRLGRLHLQFKLLAVGSDAHYTGNGADLGQRQPAGAAHLFADGTRLNLRRRALGHDAAVL